MGDARDPCSEVNLHKLLNKIYHDPESVGSFGGVKLLYHELRRRSQCEEVKPEFVKKWLKTNPVYTLHKPVRRNFPRVPIVVDGPGKQWQIDLIDVASIRDQNDGNTFILSAIDVFSRKAYLQPIKNKSAFEVLGGFKHIYENSGENIEVLQSDQGKEFYNGTFQAYLRSKNIQQFSTLGSETKAAIVERFHRTILERLYRYFSLVGKKRYIEVLQKLVDSYNQTPHRTLGFVAPNAVSDDNKEDIKKALYGTHKVTYAFRRLSKEEFVVDQFVRLSLLKKNFEKGFLQGWSSEVYRVLTVEATEDGSRLYIVKDLKDEPVKGRFYPWQLQSVDYTEEELVHVQELARKKGKVLVHYVGWDKKFDEWMTLTKLKKLTRNVS